MMNDLTINQHPSYDLTLLSPSKRLEWTSRGDLEKPRFARAELHFFAAEMLSWIIRCEGY
jgi:hypothetical protein